MKVSKTTTGKTKVVLSNRELGVFLNLFYFVELGTGENSEVVGEFIDKTDSTPDCANISFISNQFGTTINIDSVL